MLGVKSRERFSLGENQCGVTSFDGGCRALSWLRTAVSAI